jgi:hypothetical protein
MCRFVATVTPRYYAVQNPFAADRVEMHQRTATVTVTGVGASGIGALRVGGTLHFKRWHRIWVIQAYPTLNGRDIIVESIGTCVSLRRTAHVVTSTLASITERSESDMAAERSAVHSIVGYEYL